jgi:hypothetical protein
MDRKILIFGATGNTGLEICKELESLDIKHSAFVRKGSESKIQTKHTGIIFGDVLHMKDVENAIDRQRFTDIVIALGSRNLKGENIRSNGTKNIVDFLTLNSIDAKLHVVSAHGVGNSWSQLKWHEKLISKLFIAKTMKDHELQEEIVKSNTGGFHIIRPVALKNEPSKGSIHCISEGGMPNGSISRIDVAKFLVKSIMDNKKGFSSICNK